jgi:hypothetical protein
VQQGTAIVWRVAIDKYRTPLSGELKVTNQEKPAEAGQGGLWRATMGLAAHINVLPATKFPSF